MDFLKKHYEKVVMAAVLLGLVVSAALLPLMIAGERRSLQDMADKIITRPVKPLATLDLTKQDALLRRMQAALTLDFKDTNKLFNSVPWQRTPPPENRLIKVQKGNIGVEAVMVTKTSPLYLILSLDGVSTNSTGVRYAIGVEREAAIKTDQRKKRTFYAAQNNKFDTFVIREVKGPVDNPNELLLQSNETPERIVLKKGTPFKQVDGYTADLKYEPERKTWPGVRAGVISKPPIIVAGEEYIIIAITKNEVVLSAKLNNKKTSIPYNPGS
jgi:hypothetical protein